MIKRLLLIAVFAGVVLSFLPLTSLLQTRTGVTSLAQQYLNRAPTDYNIPNIVTAIVVSYRGLDTLGEVTVLFAAAVGVSLALGFRRKARPGKDEPVHAEPTKVPASEILQTGAGLLLPLILAFGVYIFLHGHLTPGGGFQGGVVIASGLLLALLAGTFADVPHGLLQVLEMLSGASYVAIGALGLWLGAGFLDPRFLPAGEFGQVYSSGAIPLIYSLVGIKVGSELATVISDLRRNS
ncbi:MAG: hydrogen gas-evolving membrane-bound hydrogenase subunit E [Spirochaetales bacterium]